MRVLVSQLSHAEKRCRWLVGRLAMSRTFVLRLGRLFAMCIRPRRRPRRIWIHQSRSYQFLELLSCQLFPLGGLDFQRRRQAELWIRVHKNDYVQDCLGKTLLDVS